MLADLSNTLMNIFLVLGLVWLVVLIAAIVSLYRRTDMLMPVKLFWAIILLVAPVIGLLFYVVVTTKKRRLR
ncbi:hypothetical protein [Deminuibacter soli]|uniref:Cardiolipin synthase N-terminal domain-containing protein n=1 Tax=Deminuibacter soli TaxID=2291815 RepID=A0A3E1NIQ5_9BACT|nr:hypothetical protein [Deminuibacter soli]RFM27761.1 hypothetical protein DXN05_13755 [Deminuibacter soli]